MGSALTDAPSFGDPSIAWNIRWLHQTVPPQSTRAAERAARSDRHSAALVLGRARSRAAVARRCVARGDDGRYTLGMIEKPDAGATPANPSPQRADAPAATAEASPR